MRIKFWLFWYGMILDTFEQFAKSFVASSVARTFTNPLDVSKIIKALDTDPSLVWTNHTSYFCVGSKFSQREMKKGNGKWTRYWAFVCIVCYCCCRVWLLLSPLQKLWLMKILFFSFSRFRMNSVSVVSFFHFVIVIIIIIILDLKVVLSLAYIHTLFMWEGQWHCTHTTCSLFVN